MRKFFNLISLLVFCLAVCSKSFGAVPVITTQPVNDSVCVSANPVFSIVAADTSSTLTLHYLWQVSTDGGTSWSAVGGSKYSGDTTSSLTINNDSTFNNYLYRCIVTDTSGSVTSSSAKLSVSYPLSAGSITASDSVCIGASVTLTHTVSGGVWSSFLSTLATVNSSGVVSGVAKGTDTIYYSVSNICGTFFAKGIVRVDSLPNSASLTGTSPICVSTNDTFTATLPGGVWSHSNIIADTLAAAAGAITGRAQGFDTIKYTIADLHACASTSKFVVRIDTTVVAVPITGPTNVCRGDNIRLMDANVLGTWIWTASNSNASVTSGGWVHGSSYGLNGMDTISYMFTNTCNSVNDSFVVQIDTLINPGTISGATSLCAGSWIHLTASSSGGFWENDNHVVAVVDAIGNVTGYSQGTTVVSYQLSSGSCGYSIATHSVTVNALAGPINGIDSVGVGHTATLSDTTVNGTWSSSNNTICTIGSSTGIVTGIATGTCNISYTVTNACGTTYTTLLMYVGTPPSAGTITGPSIVCIGHVIGLSDAAFPGGVWSIDSPMYATISPTSGTVNGISTGGNLYADSTKTVHALYIIHNAFGYDTISHTITVRHSPVLILTGPKIVGLGGSYFIDAIPYGGTWSLSNNHVGEIAYVTDSSGLHERSMATLVVLNDGTDTITYTYTDPHGCGTVDSIFVVSLGGGSVNGVKNVAGENIAMQVYPNPTTGQFTINIPSTTDEQVLVTVSNLVGEKVKEIRMNTNEPAIVNMDEPAGIYILSAMTSGGRSVVKINLNK